MNKKRKSKTQNTSVKGLVIKTLLGSLVSVVVFFILTLLAAFVLWKNDSDISLYNFVICIIGAFAGFAGGFVAVRPVRKRGMVFGALSALIPCVIVMTASVLLSKSGIAVVGWIFLAVYILFSALGGIIAANKRK